MLSLYIQPGAKQTIWAGTFNGALKLRLATPPVDGKANAALCAFLAHTFKVPKSAVLLVSGQSSRTKRVEIQGFSESILAEFIQAQNASISPE